MPTVFPSPLGGPKVQFELADGEPAVGNKLFFYISGTTTKQNTYTDSTGTVPNANPVVLNALGMPSTEIWFAEGLSYKIVYAPSTDTDPPTSPIFTVDDLVGINDVAAAVTALVGATVPTKAQLQNQTFVYFADSGSADALAITPVPAVAAYATGLRLMLKKSNAANATTTPSLNVNGLGAKIIYKRGGLSLAVNDMLANGHYTLEYDAAYNGSVGGWDLINPATSPGLIPGAIYGYTTKTNIADPGNDIDIASGTALDSTGTFLMTGVSMVKRTDVAWQQGDLGTAGALDTGAIGNGDYYIYVIAEVNSGAVDYLVSLSPTAPTMPFGWNFKRRIGWFKRVAGANVAFTTYETAGGGLKLLWTTPTLDINLANTLTTARRTDAVKVPLDFSVVAHLTVLTNDATTVGIARICCPDETDAAPSATAAPLGNNIIQDAADAFSVDMDIQTSATGLIAARSTLATVDLYAVQTNGFTWSRRN
jgi:hypothetical protein